MSSKLYNNFVINSPYDLLTVRSFRIVW